MIVYLLDTMVVSETIKARQNKRVLQWLEGLGEDQLRVSSVTFAEIEKGIGLLAPGEKKEQLRRWIDEALPAIFANRILDFDVASAKAWGAMEAAIKRTLPTRDAMIAATAIAHGLVVATRNTKHFARLEVETVDPWSP